jgi:Ca2+-dependent lipid-binding protein
VLPYRSIKHTLITLVGLPKVSVAITPIHKRLLPNMMDIPFLSRFISESINSAAKEYIAPKSLMLDLQQLLSGDGIFRGKWCNGVREYAVN